MPLPLFVMFGAPVLAQVRSNASTKEKEKIRSKLSEEDAEYFINFLEKNTTEKFMRLAREIVNNSNSKEIEEYNLHSINDLSNILKKSSHIARRVSKAENLTIHSNNALKQLYEAAEFLRETNSLNLLDEKVKETRRSQAGVSAEREDLTTIKTEGHSRTPLKTLEKEALDALKLDMRIGNMSVKGKRPRYQGTRLHGLPSEFIMEHYAKEIEDKTFHVSMLREADPGLYNRLLQEIKKYNQNEPDTEKHKSINDYAKTKEDMLNERTNNLLTLFDMEDPDALANFVYSIKGRTVRER